MILETAIILAGGKGMRLRPYTNTIPKPMIEIQGKPLIGWIINWLIKNNIKKIVIGVAHKKEILIEWINSTSFPVEIVISEHYVKSGTGGGIKHAIKNGEINDDNFLAMNGDELTDLALSNLYRFHLINGKSATILVTPLRSNFGVVEIGEENLIKRFREKPIIDTIFINSGIYILTPEVEPYLSWESDVERDTFVKLAEENKICAFRYFGFWRTVNTEKDLEAINNEIKYLRQ
ncbi:MAG: NDP-sugar synthase [Promethearchaeota archaeon]